LKFAAACVVVDCGTLQFVTMCCIAVERDG